MCFDQPLNSPAGVTVDLWRCRAEVLDAEEPETFFPLRVQIAERRIPPSERWTGAELPGPFKDKCFHVCVFYFIHKLYFKSLIYVSNYYCYYFLYLFTPKLQIIHIWFSHLTIIKMSNWKILGLLNQNWTLESVLETQYLCSSMQIWIHTS